MKIYFLFTVIFISTSYVYGKQNVDKASIKALIVREIMSKVSNITFNSLSKVSNDKKENVLRKIEKKLKKTAKDLVDGEKYVKIIMQQFADRAYAKEEKNDDNYENTEKSEDINNQNDNQESSEKKNNFKQLERVRTENLDKLENSSSNRKIFDFETKQQIIIDIANKIESVAKTYLRSNQTLDEQKAILKKIEKRIIDSSKRKHRQIHNQHTELKTYSELITQGLELSMKRLLKTSDSRRVLISDSKETKIPIHTGHNDIHEKNLKLINQYKAFFSEVLSDSSIDPRCTEIVESVCLRIDSLHRFYCGDGKTVGLEQLCDGIYDCWNEADEINCTVKVIDKIEQSLTLMSDIEETVMSKCLQSMVGRPLFSNHHKLLMNVLKSQSDLLKNHKLPIGEFNITSEIIEEDKKLTKKKVGDASTVVNLLSSALEINLCLPSERPVNKQILNRRTLSEVTGNALEQIWSPKSCICNQDVCKLQNCDARCKHICSQKYSLNRWSCQSVSEETSISLNLICDGKLDCYDESDETFCATGSKVMKKFESNGMFIELLDLLALKALSVEFEYSRNKIVALAGLVRQIQKLSTSSNDLHAIKLLRDDYFKMLVHIYSDALRIANLDEIDRTYEFLILLNEKMVEALKCTHTGNENILPPAGCYCRNGTCAQVRCPHKCIPTCLVEPILTTYSCNINNLTVNLKDICNGKKDCPNEQDEKDCKKDICRSHHLLMLRNNLEKAGLTLKGTALGAALDKWRAKVTTTIKIAETHERPNHMALEEIIIDILHDLVSTYASMEETRKNSAERITREFINISNIVKDTLKSCVN